MTDSRQPITGSRLSAVGGTRPGGRSVVPQPNPGLEAGDLQLARIVSQVTVTHEVAQALEQLVAQLRQDVAAIGETYLPPPAGGQDDRLNQLLAENAQLREAMAGRAVIEQAKGVLMARESLSADEAFERLAGISRRERRRVRDVAAAVLASAGSVPPA